MDHRQQKIIDGYFSTLEILRADVDGDGYITATDVGLITSYVNKVTNAFPVGSSFTHLCFQVQQSIGRYDGYFDCDGYVRLDGYTGQNIVDPSSLSPSELIYDGYISQFRESVHCWSITPPHTRTRGITTVTGRMTPFGLEVFTSISA